jgi:VanZ family protein
MRVLVALFAAIGLSVFLVVPDPFALIGIVRPETRDAVEDVLSDKAQHAISYAVLAIALRFAFQGPPRRAALWSGGLAMAHGAASELIQLFVPHRSCDWKDFLADALGAVIGLTLWNAVTLWPGLRREPLMSTELPPA